MPDRLPSMQPPRISPLALNDLHDGNPDHLRPRSSHERQRFHGVDLNDADLSGSEWFESEWVGWRARTLDMEAAQVRELKVQRLDAPVLLAARASVHRTSIAASRFGSLELYDSDLAGVRISDTKLGVVNLRSASLRDVLFQGCTIDELDLTGARLLRVAFVDTKVRTLGLRGTKSEHVDLRGLDMHELTNVEGLNGMTISSHQLASLSGMFAAHLRVNVDG